MILLVKKKLNVFTPGAFAMNKDTNFVQKLENFVANLGNKFESSKEIFEVSSSVDVCENNAHPASPHDNDGALNLSLRRRNSSDHKTLKTSVMSSDDCITFNSWAEDLSTEDRLPSIKRDLYNKNEQYRNKKISRMRNEVLHQESSQNENYDSTIFGAVLRRRPPLLVECCDCGKNYTSFIDLTSHMIERSHYGNLASSVKRGLTTNSNSRWLSNVLRKNAKRVRKEDNLDDSSNIETARNDKRIKSSHREEINFGTKGDACAKSSWSQTDFGRFTHFGEPSIHRTRAFPRISSFIVVPWPNLYGAHPIPCCSPQCCPDGSQQVRTANNDDSLQHLNCHPGFNKFIDQKSFLASSPLRNLESMVHGDLSGVGSFPNLRPSKESINAQQHRTGTLKNLGTGIKCFQMSLQQPLSSTMTDAVLQKLYDYQQLAIRLLSECDHK